MVVEVPSVEDLLVDVEDLQEQDSSSDEPLMVSVISNKLASQCADILCSHLGYERHTSGPGEVTSSKLSFIRGKGPDDEVVSTPVDVLAYRMFEASKTGPMTKFDLAPFKVFKLQPKDEEAIFTAPSISEETQLKMNAEVSRQKGKESLRGATKDNYAFNNDVAARAGMRVASTTMLVSESLSRALSQEPDDPSCLSRKDIIRLTSQLGPMAKLMYESFARIARESVKVRRKAVLDCFDWPSTSARTTLESLPLLGTDLFNDQFMTVLKGEVERHKEGQLATFAPAQPPRTSSAPRTKSRGRGQAYHFRPSSNKRGRGRGKDHSTDRKRESKKDSKSTRGYRGPPNPRGRGFPPDPPSYRP